MRLAELQQSLRNRRVCLVLADWEDLRTQRRNGGDRYALCPPVDTQTQKIAEDLCPQTNHPVHINSVVNLVPLLAVCVYRLERSNRYNSCGCTPTGAVEKVINGRIDHRSRRDRQGA